MRVFIDACIDPRVVKVFRIHEVRTAFDMGWHGLKDHLLLPLAQENFDVFVTADRGFEYEHNLKKLRVAIVIVHVPKNKVQFYEALAEPLLEAVTSTLPGAVTHVPAQPFG
jgi:hypothetical protein